ncbi:MAG: TatD family hydrolase [Halieaceae bacterium]|jgi:TatD DNase family protein|nr:TatD family hydrolase [Halieaceae bacterium]
MSKKKRPPIPHFDQPIIETHCHLDYLDAEELADALAAAAAVGVKRIVTIAVSPDNLDRVIEISEGADHIWCTQGIHPHEAETWTADIASRVREGCQHPKVVAVGELGLDYFYDHADRKAQAAAFDEQLQIAAECSLPIVVHTREADADTEAVLRNHLGTLSKRGVIHSFTSGLALAEFCLSEGFMLGFNGITTFRNADNVRAVVEATPVEQLVLETDAPYLTPVPYRGVRNAPCYLPFIAEKVAEVKQLPVETLLKHAWDNSLRLFFDAA